MTQEMLSKVMTMKMTMRVTSELKHVNYMWYLINPLCSDISGEEFDPNIDDEIMKGYEEFLQDFEDHLLLQEFGGGASN